VASSLLEASLQPTADQRSGLTCITVRFEPACWKRSTGAYECRQWCAEYWTSRAEEKRVTLPKIRPRRSGGRHGFETLAFYSARESNSPAAKAGSEFRTAPFSGMRISPQLSEKQRGRTAFSGHFGGEQRAASPQLSVAANAGLAANRARETAIRAWKRRALDFHRERFRAR
jgi:hypothetical protein